MTQDDIIRMAREAGITMSVKLNPKFETESTLTKEQFCFAALVAAAERNACAKVCDRMAARCNDIRAAALESAAENIRARSNP